MNTTIVLLRGINLGGKNKLPMKDFAALLADIGCTDVQTYIQSGNAVFQAPDKMASELAERIERELASRLGLKVPVVMRTAAELSDVAQSNPFLAAGEDESTLHVAFLAEQPTPERVNTLDADRSPPDRFAVRGREIYLHFPSGLARSKLTNAYFDSKLGTISTVRNWRTVLKLVETADAISAS